MTNITSHYQTHILKYLEAGNAADRFEPRQLEGIMRANYGTLDGLSSARFNRAIREAMDERNGMTDADAESVARSYGL
jgi:hypothetical protein